MFNKSTRPFKSPTNTAISPLDFQAELDSNPKGERNCSYHGRIGLDLTAAVDEGYTERSQVVFCTRESGDQEPLVPGTLITISIPDIEQKDNPTSECY